MERYQTGEVMLVMMVVMMTIVLLSRGHMGMMGHGGGHTPHAVETTPQNTTAPTPQSAPGASAAPQR